MCQWTHNGTVLAGAAGPSLTLPSVQAADSGLYSLTASNSSGAGSATCRLDVLASRQYRTRVFAWGDNGMGQCQVPVDLTNAVAIAGGGSHTVALRRMAR